MLWHHPVCEASGHWWCGKGKMESSKSLVTPNFKHNYSSFSFMTVYKCVTVSKRGLDIK